MEHGTIKRVSSANRVVKVLTKTRKARPVAKNVMRESRQIAWGLRPVKSVSRVSTRTYRNYVIGKSVEKLFRVNVRHKSEIMVNGYDQSKLLWITKTN